MHVTCNLLLAVGSYTSSMTGFNTLNRVVRAIQKYWTWLGRVHWTIMKSMSEVKAFLFNYELPAIQQSANPRHDTYDFDGSEHKPLDFYIILYWSDQFLLLVIIGHFNNIPTMQFFTGVYKNTWSKSYMLSWIDWVWDFQNNVLWVTHRHTLFQTHDQIKNYTKI